MNRAEVLSMATECITKTRQDQHGNPENTFADIAALWSSYLDAQISPAQVAWMMVLFKVARAKNNPLHVDNAVDAAGYAALAVELATASLDVEASTLDDLEKWVGSQ